MTALVVFEGPDASGKTVQTSAVARALRTQGIDADWWNHPVPTVCDARTPWSLALFYAAARARVAGSIAADHGRAVLVVDRWWFSTDAAWMGSPGGPLKRSVSDLIEGEQEMLPEPALTVLLTAPGELLDVRLARRGELRPKDVSRVRENYAALARDLGWPVVQTDRPRDVVTHELVALVCERLGLPSANVQKSEVLAQVPPAAMATEAGR